jgi:hypothetical protein
MQRIFHPYEERRCLGANSGKEYRGGVKSLRKKCRFGVFGCCRLSQGMKPYTHFIGFFGAG